MQLVPPSRRAAGLLAACTIGLSTSVLGAGVASAAPLPALSLSTASAGTASGTVPAGICAVDWHVVGGQAGAVDGVPGAPGGEMFLTTLVQAGDRLSLGAGAQGAAGAAGGASEVRLGGAVVLSAGGGRAAGGSTATNAGFERRLPLRPSYDSAQAGLGQGVEGTRPTGDGLVTGTGVLCTRPLPPQLKEPEVRTFETYASIPFVAAGAGGYGPTGIPFQPADGWEYSLDGGSWTSFRAGATPTGSYLGLLLEHLELGKSYELQLRATSVVGPGEATAPRRLTPIRTYLPPTKVTTEVGVRSLTVSWTPPADVAGVTGWTVRAAPPWSEDAGASAPSECITAAADFDCTIPVTPGVEYEVTVSAVSTGAYQSFGGHPVYSDEVPDFVAPDTAPTATAPLELSAAGRSVVAGAPVAVNGSGYAPRSWVDVVIYSTPRVLATVQADEDGAFAAVVTVPVDLAAGSHTLVAAGVDDAGDPRYLTVQVAVAAATESAPGGAPSAAPGAADGGATTVPAVQAGATAPATGAPLPARAILAGSA